MPYVEPEIHGLGVFADETGILVVIDVANYTIYCPSMAMFRTPYVDIEIITTWLRYIPAIAQ